MKRSNVPLYQATAEDFQARQELQIALMQIEGLPAEDRWSLLFEMMTDAWLCYILKSRILAENVVTERLMPLAFGLVEAFSNENYHSTAEKADVLLTTAYHLLFSAVAEIERRNLQFCTEVLPLPNPFVFFGQQETVFKPKDPETFDIEVLLEYYSNLCTAT